MGPPRKAIEDLPDVVDKTVHHGPHVTEKQPALGPRDLTLL